MNKYTFCLINIQERGCFRLIGYLILSDGTTFEGEIEGDFLEPCEGELVFYTGMTGYQEVLTDPSYKDQIVVFTYPLIGNYGINEKDFESKKPQVKGVVVFQATAQYSHYLAKYSLQQYLNKWNIPYITNIDTRAIVKKIRSNGSQIAAITAKPLVLFEQKLSHQPVKEVSGTKIETYGEGDKHIALLDFGYKKSILTSLLKRGCKVSVVPVHSLNEIHDLSPDGLVLSNGPGDPKQLENQLPQIFELISKYPTLGICLGHQLIALSLGGNTKKLRFGHRGANHPVIDHKRGKVFMTSQNHSYVVDANSLEPLPVHVRFTNVNDQSVEGLAHEHLPILSVQFHPEANPGPEDADWVFDEFLEIYVAARREKVYA